MTSDSTEEESNSVVIAAADTVLGQLQRGRGAGFLAALELPSSQLWPLLVECITHDPRWDPQVEHRAEMYAELMIASRMDLAPVEALVRAQDPTNKWSIELLPFQVVVELAKRGDRPAFALLRDMVRNAEEWSHAFDALEEIGTPDALEGLDEILMSRAANDDEVERRLPWDDNAPPWSEWRDRHPRIRAAFEAQKRERDSKTEASDQLEGLSVSQLLDSEAQDWSPRLRFVRERIDEIAQPSDVPLLLSRLDATNPRVCYRALGALKHFSSVEIFVALRAFAEANPNIRQRLMGVMSQALQAQPIDLVLPCGREWFDHPDWPYRVMGHHILAENATVEDVPRLTRALSESLADPDDVYRAGNILEAFSRVPDAGPIPEIDRAFVETRYSFTREQAAAALHATQPHEFEADRAFECLWDCRYATREIGISAVDLAHRGAHARVEKLASDPFEDDEVRQTAQRRLWRSTTNERASE